MARIALIDCGVGDCVPVAAAGAFAANGTPRPPVPPGAAHAAMLAAIISEQAPGAELLDAQVFTDGPATTAAAVAAGIDWAVAQGARVINLSLGLSQDRPVLAAACDRAVTADVLVVASSPARGGPVYPAAYPRVIRVCGDARCGPGEFSLLNTAQADLGACVRAPGAACGDRARSGPSLAAASVSGRLAALLGDGMDGPAALRALVASCRWHGPERRV